jgi:hypothetical protein
MRQRITIFNPGSSNDDILKLVNQTHLNLETKSHFLQETKSTLSTAKNYHLIKELRITQVHEQITNKIFGYNYANGLSINVQPNTLHKSFTKDDFFNQVSQLLNEVVGISIDEKEWIQNVNSLYFYDISTKTTFQYPNWNGNPCEITDFHWKNDAVIIKQLQRLPDNSVISWNLTPNYQEIGLFMIDKTISSDDDIVLSGIRVILDENSSDDDYIFKTLFHIKPRHRTMGQIHHNVVSNGLHPKLLTNTTFSPPVDDDDVVECKLYYYVPLSKSLIFDKYQSIPCGAELVVSNGEENLELPAYKIDKWGQEVMFELPWNFSNEVELTVHSRYQLPQESVKSTEIININPMVFYGCDVRDSYLLEKSPFDNRLSIGGNYETYFTNNTVFYHFISDNDTSTFTIPNGYSTFERINTISTVAISLGVVMVLARLVGGFFFRKSTDSVKKNQ